MDTDQDILMKWSKRVVMLSLLLIFFTIPHTLEDFATGAPEDAGIPTSVLAFVISVIFGLQGAGLYFLGKGNRLGYYVHIGLGLFWPIASGFAQLPTILSDVPYRSGTISMLYVFGMIVVGLFLLFASFMALSKSKKE